MGVHPNYVESEAIKTASGRFINRNDVKERRKVIILHKKSAEILFGKSRTEPVGRFVNAGGVAYRVVGLYEDQGDQSSLAFIPFSTMQTIYNKGDKLNNIIFTTKNLTSETANETFEKEYRKVIAANHRFDPEDEGAIWIWNQLYTIHTDTERSRLVAYRHLGDRYFYPAERHRRRIEHHADYRQGTHTRVRHTRKRWVQSLFLSFG